MMTPDQKAELTDRIYEKQWEEITHWLREYNAGLEAENVMISHVNVGDGIEYTIIYSVDDNDGVLIKTDTEALTVAESHRDLCLDGDLIAKIAELHTLHLIKTKGYKP